MTLDVGLVMRVALHHKKYKLSATEILSILLLFIIFKKLLTLLCVPILNNTSGRSLFLSYTHSVSSQTAIAESNETVKVICYWVFQA